MAAQIQTLSRQSLSQNENPIQVKKKKNSLTGNEKQICLCNHFILLYCNGAFNLSCLSRTWRSCHKHGKFPSSFSQKPPRSLEWDEFYSPSGRVNKLLTPAYFQGTLQGRVFAGHSCSLDITLTTQRKVWLISAFTAAHQDICYSWSLNGEKKSKTYRNNMQDRVDVSSQKWVTLF